MSIKRRDIQVAKEQARELEALLRFVDDQLEGWWRMRGGAHQPNSAAAAMHDRYARALLFQPRLDGRTLADEIAAKLQRKGRLVGPITVEMSVPQCQQLALLLEDDDLSVDDYRNLECDRGHERKWAALIAQLRSRPAHRPRGSRDTTKRRRTLPE